MTTPNKRPHASTPIGRLLNRYAISLGDVQKCLLAEKAKFTGKSTLHRMVRGEISDEMRESLHPVVARCLSKFLVARGLDKAEIDAELTTVFTKGEYQPMIKQRIELRRDEIEWFGLKTDPFTAFPDSRGDVFIAPPFQRVIDRVFDALKFPVFLAVTGEIGSGKDVLRAMVEDHVATQSSLNIVWPEFMNQKRITEMHIARAILRHFNYPIPRGVEDLGFAVKRCLETEFRAGNRIALGFNECHHLNDTALSSLKNFFEMGSGGFQRWLSVLLIGQPSFATTAVEAGKKIMRGRIFAPQFRELAERIVIVEMPTGTEFSAHAADYMRFRLKRAGAGPDLFDQPAIDYISRNASTPQMLGNIANDALRISKEDFQEKRVIGAALKTKMHFPPTSDTEPGFKRRAA